jgi:putative FmdB family regulatory protein
MPIYEFSCRDCSSKFETLVLNSQESVKCPQCGSLKLEKLISAHAVGSTSAEVACDMPACGTGACPAACQ